jgi:hypothetical protein
MCSLWSGFSYDHMMKLVRSGTIAAIAMGPESEMCGHRRSCAKFLIPSQPFRAFVEGLGAGSRITAGPRLTAEKAMLAAERIATNSNFSGLAQGTP